MQKVIVSVINDLATDQRVHRTCITLQKMGYDVALVGRKLPASLPVDRMYKTHRFRLLFTKGPLFYAEYTMRLLLYLLFHKADLYFANDLDTLLPNYIVSKLKGKKLVYDSHEIFTEVPELQNATLKKKIWTFIEKTIFPNLKTVITVNQSIADHYQKLYNNKLYVVRNIPHSDNFKNITFKKREQLGMPLDKNVIILQGSGINIHRGAEEMLEAMQYINNAVLYIIGGGDVVDQLKINSKRLNLGDKVVFIGKLPFTELIQYTRNANLGLTLDRSTNINYQLSLPNKLFDYIHCNLPVLASPLVEIKKIIEHYNVGAFIDKHDPLHIAEKVNSLLSTQGPIEKWKENTIIAARELSWENEETILVNAIKEQA